MSSAIFGERVADKATAIAGISEQAAQRQSSEQTDMDASPGGLTKVVSQGLQRSLLYVV